MFEEVSRVSPLDGPRVAAPGTTIEETTVNGRSAWRVQLDAAMDHPINLLPGSIRYDSAVNGRVRRP